MSDDDSDVFERGVPLSIPRELDTDTADTVIDPELARRYQLIEESITRVKSLSDKKRNEKAAGFYARMLAAEAADNGSLPKPGPPTPPE